MFVVVAVVVAVVVVVCCLLFVVCCLLFGVCCLLFVVVVASTFSDTSKQVKQVVMLTGGIVGSEHPPKPAAWFSNENHLSQFQPAPLRVYQPLGSIIEAGYLTYLTLRLWGACWGKADQSVLMLLFFSQLFLLAIFVKPSIETILVSYLYHNNLTFA